MTDERIAAIAEKKAEEWADDEFLDGSVRLSDYVAAAIREALAEEREAIWKAALNSESRSQGND